MSRQPVIRRLSLALIFMTSIAGAAWAGSEPATKAPPNAMDLQPMGLPAVVQGRLVNYIFVDLRLMLGNGADAAHVAMQEPYLRDALVRAANHAPFNPPQDGVHLDEGKLRAEMMRDAARVLGPGKVLSVVVISQTPQRRVGVPGAVSP